MAKRKPGRRQYIVEIQGPRPVDVHVGERVRTYRTLSGMSQEALGECLGLTFQQVQKYERGWNRISASRLWSMSQLFGVPVSAFYEGIGKRGPKAQGVRHKRETLELVRAFSACPGHIQNHLLSLIKAAADQRPRKPKGSPSKAA